MLGSMGSTRGTLGARYWIERSQLDDAGLQQLRRALTIRARFDGEDFVALDEADDARVGVPRAWGLENFGPPRREEGQGEGPEEGPGEEKSQPSQPTPALAFTKELRPYQVRAVDDVCARLRAPACAGGLIEARPGTGKTVMALHVACRLGARTLVIVNRGLLLEQWKERARQFTNVETVGEICQDRCRVDAPIVVGMMQSLACRDYDPSILAGFDLVVVDEVHRVCARVMSQSLCMPARWYLGLSATMERTDGRHAFLAWTFGPDRVLVSTATQTVRVRRCPLESSSHVARRIQGLRPGLTPIQKHAQTISILAGCSLRTNQLAALASDAVHAGRFVLLVSDRVKQLEALRARLEHIGVGPLQTLTGKTRPRDRDIAAGTRVVLATINLVKEGWDGVPHYDTLLVCSPVSNEVVLRQLHGRIMRPHPGKGEPLVLDVCDTADEGGATKRRRMYARVTRDPTAGPRYDTAGCGEPRGGQK